MNIGLVDVDLWSRKYKCTFPNLALMKISAFHKAQGDHVEWHNPWFHYDLVYMSKVFSNEYTKDYELPIDADRIIKGGSGYAFSVESGKEVYAPELDPPLSDKVSNMFPDYSIYEEYGIKDTAYGYLTKGCPRGCAFCHVVSMQGRAVYTVARLRDFWNGQKYIELCDPNITASKDWDMHMKDLIDSKSYVTFSQGLDIRMLTPEKIEDLNHLKWKRIHFAWDRPQEDLRQKFLSLKEHLKRCRRDTVSCYILTNFDSTYEQDLERVMFIRSLNIQPYVMIYRKDTAPPEVRRLQSWANNPFRCWKIDNIEDFDWKVRSKR